MKSSFRCSKGPEGTSLIGLWTQRSDTAGKFFFFCNFMEAFPTMFIHKLSHLKCTKAGKGMQKAKMGSSREVGRTKQESWVSHIPDHSFNLQPLFTHLNVSDSGPGCCHVVNTSRWQKSGSEGPFLAEGEWTSSTCATVLQIQYKEGLVLLDNSSHEI